MSATADKRTPSAPYAGGDMHPDCHVPGPAIRWQAAFYRTYLTDALKRLADDPNPDVQRIGVEMNQCLNCSSAERCTDCPFRRGSTKPASGAGMRD